MRKFINMAALLTATAAFVGCGDPYKETLLIDARLTPTQAEKIADKLKGDDRDLFLRWAKRRTLGQSFGGEPTARTVRDAVANQAEFEARQAAEFAEEAKQKEAAARAAEAAQAKRAQEHAALQEVGKQRAAVDVEIRKSLHVEFVGYEFRPLFNNTGLEIARQWVMKLRVRNSSPREVIGAAGYVTIRDAFGKELGTYPLRVEFRIGSGKTVPFDVSMEHNKNNANHRALVETQTIFPMLFMESLAFADGSRIDHETMWPTQPVVPAKTDQKFGRGATS